VAKLMGGQRWDVITMDALASEFDWASPANLDPPNG
jgi:hypothetical protein